jgi:hypothetical protein
VKGETEHTPTSHPPSRTAGLYARTFDLSRESLGGWPTFRHPWGTLPQLRLPHPSRFSMGGKQGPQSNLDTRTFVALRRRTPPHVSDPQGLRFVPPTFRKPRKVGQPHLVRVSQHRGKVGQPPVRFCSLSGSECLVVLLSSAVSISSVRLFIGIGISLACYIASVALSWAYPRDGWPR